MLTAETHAVYRFNLEPFGLQLSSKMTCSLPITILIEVRPIVLYILGGSIFRDSLDEILKCDYFNERFSSS